MTVPILQIPLTVGVHINVHTNTYTAEHLPCSPASVSQASLSSVVESAAWHLKVLIEEGFAALSAAES